MNLILVLCIAAFGILVLLPVDTVESAVASLQQAPLRCRLGSKLCKDGKECVLYSHVCDGEADCLDGSDEEDCAMVCNIGQFQCAHGKKCIDTRQVCDGIPQCQDRSDEADCFKHEDGCAHRCDKSRCLPASFLCDGDTDCMDGTDEDNCDGDEDKEDGGAYEPEETTSNPGPLKCPLGSKLCSDGTDCVLYNHVCDGEEDCKDGSDEEDCSVQCETGQFQCAHGKKCIDTRQVCDGLPQCQDRSDEADCFKLEEGCAHRCENNSRCIPESFLCDGDADCLDGTDELNCADESCSSAEFRCGSGQCVSVSMHCDGHPDCRDHSDEEGCAKPPHCTTEHRCPHSHECLLEEWLCDGEKDCKDGTDEKNCKEVEVACGEFQWLCASKTQCIPKAWQCDGMKDCNDESDEAGCGRVTCPPHLFQCGSLECLDPAQVCNGITNCLDGSDEGGACLTAKCPSPEKSHCAQDCYSTPKGTSCWCKAGFRPQEDGVSCVDIDECVDHPDVCSHSCVNTVGSFQCNCNPGYVLEPDGHSCKITGEPYLLASVQSELFLLGLRSSSLDVLISSEKRFVFSVDYDWKEQKVYWVNLNADTIKWSSLDQKNKGTIIKGIKPDCVSVDWVGRNLYWIDGVGSQINAIGLDTTATKASDYVMILDEDLEQPRSLVLLPQKGMMYWSETGDEAHIARAGMDGSERRVLISQGLRWPVSLTVDSLEDRIYWTDEKLKCIGSATLDGGDIKLLQLMETPSPFSVSVFNDMVYWSDTRRGTIQRAHKITGKKHEVLLKRPGQPFGLKIIHPLLQVSMENPCVNHRCSHLCVLAPGSKGVCKCPTRLLLAEDGFTCSKPKDSSFALLLSSTAITQIYLQTRHSAVGLKSWPEHRRLELPNLNEPTMFDFVLRDLTLYLADAGQSTVGLFKMKDAVLVARGKLFRLQKDSVTALALDWITLNLYWSSTKQPRLQVTSAQGRHTVVLMHEDVASVESITLHPPSGRLCFTNYGKQSGGLKSHVECAYMDGRNRTLIWKNSVQPISLTLSNEGNELYWADTGLGIIASISMDGSGYKELKVGDGLTTFAFINNVFLWVTKNDTTKFWYSEDRQTEKQWFEVNTEVVSLKAYSKSSQKGTNFCSNGNGGCGHLCLPFPGGRTCRCAHDHLSINATDCAPDQRCPHDTKPCLDGRTCFPLAKFCDGHPDCPDHSDEHCVEHPSGADSPGTNVPPKATISRAPVTATSLSNDVLVRNLDSQSCGDVLCNGQGKCVAQNGGTSCACATGYSGEFCQDQLSGSLQGPLTYGAIGLCAAIVVIGALIALIQKRSNQRRPGPVVRETKMQDLEKRTTASSTQPFPKDTDFAEDVSSVD